METNHISYMYFNNNNGSDANLPLGAPPALLDLTKMKGAEGKPLKDEVPSMKKQREGTVFNVTHDN